ncbi:Hypothetical protein A7982_08461 [Minicystis rosea]|nr:Hypothetical protein A7982_08461 [Minicystis rosea]
MAQSSVRRRLGRWLVSAFLLPVLSSACGPRSGPSGGSGLTCGGVRWIGIKPGGSVCTTYLPPGPGWLGSPLFTGATAPNLTRYCLFEWDPSAGPAPTAADVAALTATAGVLKGFDEDCPVVMPLGFPEEAALAQRQTIHDAAGGLTSLPVSSSLKPTRLAVVDNAPDSFGQPGDGPVSMALLPSIQPHGTTAPFGEHGEVLAYLGSDIGCPQEKGSACAVHVETALALRDGGNPQPDVTGGLSGTRGDLATTIRRTLVDWKDDLVKRGEPRLVINLSVGWEDHPSDSDCHVGAVKDLNAPAAAVYDALVEARCHGAFIVTAAGNNTGSGGSAGLMCPAHFATWAVPECSADFYDDEFDTIYSQQTGLRVRPSTVSYDPLVHPVGALDSGDQPLAPHRPRSLPRLVGPGFLGTSYEGSLSSAQANGTLPAVAPYPLTGTSVSTMVVSSIVATGWAYAPSRAPADVMATVYDYGARTSLTTEVSPLTTASRVRRASLCRTLRGMGLIAASTTCSDPDPGTVTVQNAPLSASLKASMNAYFATGSIPTLTASLTPATPLNFLPTEAAGAFVSPQPLWPGCPTCGIEPALEAILHIDPPANMRFDNVHIVVSSQSGWSSYALGNLAGRSTFRLTRNVAVTAGTRAYLVWEESSGTAAYAQLPIW